MNSISFVAIDEIYSCSIGTSIKWAAVRFPELRAFATLLKRMIGSLDSSSKDDFWGPTISKLRKLNFEFCAAPLSQEILQDQITSLLPLLKEKITPCRMMYPETVGRYVDLIKQLEILSNAHLPRLLNTVRELPVTSPGKTALVICEPRLVPNTEKSLAQFIDLRKITITTPSLLREEKCYDDMILVGPSRWYPNYVLSAPRAKHILLVNYSWIRDHWEAPDIFLEPVKQRGLKKQKVVFSHDQEEDSLSPEEINLPAIDIQRFAQKAIEGPSHPGEEQEDFIDARVCLLEDGWAVFLEADDAASVMVIDLDRSHKTPVRRIKIGDIQPGIFVLLRTGGGGDYVVPVADRIMGDDAPIAREFQKEWKRFLRSKIKSLGYETVIRQLTLLGSERANRTNIHNWISERSIRTYNVQDFRAIMRLIGLDKDTDYYWDMMNKIAKAHLKAGMDIRTMLLEQVKTCDIDTLKKTGRMEFTLPSDQSVSITAFQVREFIPDIIPVHPVRINYPFQVEE